MRDLFPGFYKHTDEELAKLWQEGIFVFDTNMLLNVYRYTQITRDRYFEILELLKKRNQLWIPYQAAYEYQNNRMEVIQGQLDAYTDVSNMLQTTLQKLESFLGPYKRKHGYIDANKLADELTNAIKGAKATITQGKEKDKREYEALKKRDRLLEKLEDLFQGNIGNPYNTTRLEELYRQAQLRLELRIPPGWEDEGKNSFNAYGDIVLWFQLIDYARIQKKPIVFVTDDGKKDWWIRDTKGKPIKPLPALVQEMFVEADVLLHMYQGYEFLERAEQFFKLEEKPEIIEEARKITQQYILDFYNKAPSVSIAYRAEQAVGEWLKAQYPTSHEIIGSSIRGPDFPARGPDFTIIEPDGTITVVEVKYYDKLYNVHKVVDRTLDVLERSARGFSKLIIFVVTGNVVDAIEAFERNESIVNIPENVSLIIGHLEPDNQFHFVARLPES